MTAILTATVLSADNFPASAGFDVINDALQADAAERADAVKAAQAIFAFTLTNEKGETESWYLDFKNKGVVGKGTAPEGGKADGEHFFAFGSN